MNICGDEVGGNLSMKLDGYVVSKKLLTGVRNVPKLQTSNRNRKFTMICLTVFTGKPVMCIFILEGKHPKGNIEAGFEFTVTPVGNNSKPEFILHNSDLGKYYSGGHEYTLSGKIMQAFIYWHKSASISTQISVEAQKTLDSYDLLPWTNNRAKPICMLDHWVVSIGLLYVTAL